VVLFAAAAAECQEPADGPVRFSFDLVADYTDNRDSSATKVATSDFYVKPRVDVLLGGERTIFDVYYVPSYRYRTNPGTWDRHSRMFHDLGIDFRQKVTSRFTVQLANELDQTDDPWIEPEATAFRRDRTYFLNKAKAGVMYDVTRKSRVDLEARHTLKHYRTAEIRPTADESSMLGAVGYRHMLARTTSLSAVLDAQRIDYPSSAAVERDFDATRALLGLTQAFGPELNGKVSAGWKTLDFKDPEQSTKAAPYFSLSLNGATVPSFRMSTSVGYSLRDSDVYPYSAQTFMGYHAGVQWDVIPELTFSVGGTYRVGTYDQDSLPAVFLEALAEGAQVPGIEDPMEAQKVLAGGRERILLLEGGFALAVGERNTIRLVQRRERMNSDLSDTFTRNATSLAFSRQL